MTANRNGLMLRLLRVLVCLGPELAMAVPLPMLPMLLPVLLRLMPVLSSLRLRPSPSAQPAWTIAEVVEVQLS